MIFLFAKPPRPGLSKTRLAAGVGPDLAASFAEAFLEDTLRQARRAGIPLTITTTEVDAPELLRLGVPLVEQGSGDLGARLEHVLRRGLQEHDRVLALGADSPGLPPERLVRAMRGTAATMVPSDDGGFVLLALSTCPRGLFDGLPWSQAHTRAAVVERLQRLGIEVTMLEPWFDVDHPADLQRLAQVPPASAPASHAVLQQLPAGVLSGTTAGREPR